MILYELNVCRGSRLLIGALIIPITILLLLILTSRNHSYVILFVLVIPLFKLNILFSSAKMILRATDNIIEIEWKKRFLFDNTNVDPINKKDIRVLVVDDYKYLRKIVTDDRIIEINSAKPLKDDFVLFVNDLEEYVLDNKGQVIDSGQYFWLYDEYTFVVVALAISIFLISRLWFIMEFYSLFLLLIPLIVYFIRNRKVFNK